MPTFLTIHVIMLHFSHLTRAGLLTHTTPKIRQKKKKKTISSAHFHNSGRSFRTSHIWHNNSKPLKDFSRASWTPSGLKSEHMALHDSVLRYEQLFG